MSEDIKSEVAVAETEAPSKSQAMSISVVIGFTIGAMGLVILLTGVFGHPENNRSDNINIDLWWGLLMIVFGLIMGGWSYLQSWLKSKKAA